MLTALLAASISLASEPDDDVIVTGGLIMHTPVLERVTITSIPWARRDHCLFALVEQTDTGPVVMDNLRVVSGEDRVLHEIPLGKRTVPETKNSYTWEMIVLLSGSAVLEVGSAGKRSQVEFAMNPDGACVVQSVIQEAK